MKSKKKNQLLKKTKQTKLKPKNKIGKLIIVIIRILVCILGMLTMDQYLRSYYYIKGGYLMIKFARLLAAGVLSVGVLAGCNAGDEGPGDDTEMNEEAPGDDGMDEGNDGGMDEGTNGGTGNEGDMGGGTDNGEGPEEGMDEKE
jgi:hypothetical protein